MIPDQQVQDLKIQVSEFGLDDTYVRQKWSKHGSCAGISDVLVNSAMF